MVFFCFIVYMLYRFYLKNVESEHEITIFGNEGSFHCPNSYCHREFFLIKRLESDEAIIDGEYTEVE